MYCESESKDSSPRSLDLPHVCTFDDSSCTHTENVFEIFVVLVFDKIYFDYDYDYVYMDKQAG